MCLHWHSFLGIASEGFVVAHVVQVVLPVPTSATEVAVTLKLTAEVWSLLDGTQATNGIFQVRVYLNLKGNTFSFYLALNLENVLKKTIV